MKIGIVPSINDEKVSLNLAYLNFAETYSDDIQIITDPKQVGGVDWLWLSGGADVDPTFFHINNYASGPVYRKMDVFQYNAVLEADTRGIPILGICRGMQLLAYMFILPMYDTCWVEQHVSGHNQSELVGHRDDVIHSVIDRKGDRFFVNSFHHQALMTLSLRPEFTHYVPHKKEFIIEAMEFNTGNTLIQAVQWHPEELMSGLPFDIQFK